MDAIDGEAATLDAADVADCLALSREAGWNQTAEDWLHFLNQGLVYGRRDSRGTIVATAALLPHRNARPIGDRQPASDAAWISMVLVTTRHRRRGLAIGLMRRCVATARAGRLDMFLDATPEGALVYESLGFQKTGLDLLRMRRGARAAAPTHDAPSAPLRRLLDADAEALGFDRSSLLTALARRPAARLHGSAAAVALSRDGDRARHLGPLYARDEQSAISLCGDVLARTRRECLIDVAVERRGLAAFLEQGGFVVERPFARMRLAAAPCPMSATLMAVAGPEFG